MAANEQREAERVPDANTSMLNSRMTRNWLMIGGLVVVIAVVVGLSFASMNGDDGMGHNGSGYSGMMGSMGEADSASLMTHMQEVLSESDYNLMAAHVKGHRDGSAMSQDQHMEEMMHRMMDGMMAELH